MNEKVIQFRKNWKSKTLNLKKSNIPLIDINKSPLEKYVNVKMRFKHLAKILFELYKIYQANKNLYNDEFIKFVGLYIIKEWPHKDFLFSSTKFNSKSTNSIKEHWTPISFFRDLFVENNITEEDFYDSLCYFYRVVMVSNSENKTLEKKRFRTTRPINAYEECNIDIKEKETWVEIYGAIDNRINK